MRTSHLILLNCIIFCFFACQGEERPPNTTDIHHHNHNHNHQTDSKSSTYNKHGISFTKPEGWRMQETPIPGNEGIPMGTYIMVEKDGEDESGQFIASIVNNKIPLRDYMDLVKDQLNQNLSLQESTITFSDLKEEVFNGTKALIYTFEHNAVDLNFQGALKSFHCGDKTIHILIQEEKSDMPKNKKGLDILKKSFSCN